MNYKNILNKIKPNKQEEKQVSDRINSFIKKLNKNLKNAKAVLGGSGAKNTWLKDAHDADIFVLFNHEKQNISNILEKVLKKTFKKFDRLHGSRDYFQIKEKDFTFEIVPIVKISKAEQALNITDISPLHAKWVNKNGKKFFDTKMIQ